MDREREAVGGGWGTQATQEVRRGRLVGDSMVGPGVVKVKSPPHRTALFLF